MKAGLLAGAALGWSRVGRLQTLVVWSLVLVAVALVAGWERAQAPSVAADRALTGAAFGLALPLLAFYLVRQVTDRRRLDEAVLEVARHGASRHWAILGLVGTVAVVLAALGGSIAAVTVAVARGLGDPLLLGDLAISAWLGILGGAAYAGLLGLGASIGRRGGGRVASLALDWFLGTGTTALAAPWPRAHLRNLLGAEPVLGLPQGAAMAILVGLGFAYVALALGRTAR